MEDFKFTQEDVKEIIGRMRIYTEEVIQQKIDHFIKSKQPKPLFITENGVEVFKDQEYFAVDDGFNIFRAFAYFAVSGKRTFSTREAAENYVLYNKPFVVTLKDISIFIEWDQLKDFKELAIKKQNTGKE